jgi:hypothetical protein
MNTFGPGTPGGSFDQRAPDPNGRAEGRSNRGPRRADVIRGDDPQRDDRRTEYMQHVHGSNCHPTLRQPRGTQEVPEEGACSFVGIIGHGTHQGTNSFIVPQNVAVVFLQPVGQGNPEDTARRYWEHFNGTNRLGSGTWPTVTYPPGSRCPDLNIDMHSSRHPREGLYDLKQIGQIPWNEREGLDPYRTEEDAFRHLWSSMMSEDARIAIIASGRYEAFRAQCRDEYNDIRRRIEDQDEFDSVLDHEFDRVIYPGSRTGNLATRFGKSRLVEWIAEQSHGHPNGRVVVVVFCCRTVTFGTSVQLLENLERFALRGAPGVLRAAFDT